MVALPAAIELQSPSPVDVAVEHAVAGRPVFPVHCETKRPRVLDWPRVATTDEATIRAWWRRWPDAMIGMPTGARSGLFVVDMDLDQAKGLDGVSALSRLVALPETLTVTTPRGGRHAYLRFDPQRPLTNARGSLPLGIDVRGDGGFVVLWGSVRTDGATYELESDREPAAVPDELRALLDTSRQVVETALDDTASRPPTVRREPSLSQLARYAAAALDAELRTVREAPEGTRNNTLNKATYKLAGYVGAGALSEREVRDGLIAAAADCGLPANEARATVASGMRSGVAKPRDLAGVGEFQVLQVDGRAPSLVTYETGAAAPMVIDFADFDGELPPPRPWAFGRILMLGAVTALAAAPGVGKTSLAMRLAVNFASGQPFGPWEPELTGPVLFLCGEEDQDELHRRMLAASHDEGVDPATLRGRLLMTSRSGAPLILARENGRAFERNDAAILALKAAVRAAHARLVVIDPLIEFHACSETNEGLKTVGAAIREIAIDCECAVLVAHHTPKGLTGDNAAGDMNALRGGGSLAGLARVVLTGFTMTEADAETWGVPTPERYRFMRVDGAKANMTLLASDPFWLERIGVDIGNATAERESDEVGTLRPVTLVRVDKATAKMDRTESNRLALARAVVRVCDDANAWTVERAVSLRPLTESVEAHGAGMKAGKAREVFLSLGDRFMIEGREIIVTNLPPRGGQVPRIVHVSPPADAPRSHVQESDVNA